MHPCILHQEVELCVHSVGIRAQDITWGQPVEWLDTTATGSDPQTISDRIVL